MNVLIVGSGGREHAMAWKVKKSPKVNKVYVAPGNAGTASEIGIENVAIAVDKLDQLVAFALDKKIDLTIVGPEVPLVLGIVDMFKASGLACFGPSAYAAQLEGSKSFCKDFMTRYHIPTATYQSFTDIDLALAYIEQQGAPIVIKADGLAAGKGVIVAQTKQEAMTAVKEMLAANVFGEAGHRVVIEEFLPGEEASFIVIADGKTALPMATSQDHKARDNGDCGPNTGGMGAYSPAPIVTPEIHERIMRDVILPTLRGMAEQGHPYTGFLYAGLMIAPNGDLKVLEYNCRLGDPETQPIMMRLQSDLIELCQAALAGELDQLDTQWDERDALGVVLAASGYPEHYTKGQVISGLPSQESETAKLFHAGTAQMGDDIVTNGGRVLCACALGHGIQEAQANAYQLAKTINWNGIYYRTDIGFKAMR